MVKEQKKETMHTEARVIPQLVTTTTTPDEHRKHMNEFARLSQKEKAA